MNEIHIASRRRKLATIEKLHPGAIVYDVTSKGEEPWVTNSRHHCDMLANPK